MGGSYSQSGSNRRVRSSVNQVFISFRGADVRDDYLNHLLNFSSSYNINYFVDSFLPVGDDLQELFKEIEKSKIAIVFFSNKYTDSKWCMEELCKIDELVKQGKLIVIPVFYKVSPDDVKKLQGEFGESFEILKKKYETEPEKILKWKDSVKSIANKKGLPYYVNREPPLVCRIISAVLARLPRPQSTQSPSSSEPSSPPCTGPPSPPPHRQPTSSSSKQPSRPFTSPPPPPINTPTSSTVKSPTSPKFTTPTPSSFSSPKPTSSTYKPCGGAPTPPKFTRPTPSSIKPPHPMSSTYEPPTPPKFTRPTPSTIKPPSPMSSTYEPPTPPKFTRPTPSNIKPPPLRSSTFEPPTPPEFTKPTPSKPKPPTRTKSSRRPSS